MYDPAPAMPAFAGQMKAAVADFLAITGKWHTQARQPFDTLLAGTGTKPDYRFITKTGPGLDSVDGVLIDTVFRLEHGRNPALSPVTRRLFTRRLGQHGYLERRWQMQGRGQARGS